MYFRLIILFWCLECLRPSLFLLFLASPCASFRSLDLSTHFRPYSDVPGISPWNWKYTLFILGIVFKGYLHSGYEEKGLLHVTSSSYRLEQAGEHPLRRFPLLGTGYPQEDKVSWCYGGSSRTISIVSVPPLQCFVPNA